MIALINYEHLKFATCLISFSVDCVTAFTWLLISKSSTHYLTVPYIKIVVINCTPQTITAVLHSPLNCAGASGANKTDDIIKTSTTCAFNSRGRYKINQSFITVTDAQRVVLHADRQMCVCVWATVNISHMNKLFIVSMLCIL